ncbi:MAG: CoB--CoM heterodisulfide reductase iron-sulfur subunit B family protein [Candidatus Thermoplasmatota archaeon]
MRYALFLGCTVPVRALNYELSARKVASKLGLELIDLQNFECCGFPIEDVNHSASIALAARNICIAEEKGLNLVTLCSACTGALTKANIKLKEDEKLREEVNHILKPLGYEFKGKIEVKHFTRALYEDIGIEKLKGFVTKPLNGINVAAHYGCHYLKPSGIFKGIESPELPESLDKLIEATGAKALNYEDKKLCCGGGILGIDEQTALKIAKIKLEKAKLAGANSLITICPFCSVMYDANQKAVEVKVGGEKYDLPVLYYPQLLGLAMGFSPKELGFNLNRVKPKEIEEKFKV